MYKLISTGDDCTAAQLLAETMVLRRASKEKKKLTGPFWREAPWNKYFGEQMIAANALLKIFSPQAIFRALKRKECNWQYSLRTKGISDIIQQEEEKLKAENERLEKSSEREFNTATTTNIVSNKGKESLRSKLD